MKIIKSSIITAIISIGILLSGCHNDRDAKTITEIPKVKPEKKNLLTDAQVDHKLDSLSLAYKGKSVNLKKDTAYRGRDFRFFRDTVTFKEVKDEKLAEDDIVKIVGETPVRNDRVKIQRNDKTGYVEYFDIAEFQFLFDIDPDYN